MSKGNQSKKNRMYNAPVDPGIGYKRRNAIKTGWQHPDKTKCPDCGGKLVTRYRRKDNGKFVGCSAYPKCHYIRQWVQSDGE